FFVPCESRTPTAAQHSLIEAFFTILWSKSTLANKLQLTVHDALRTGASLALRMHGTDTHDKNSSYKYNKNTINHVVLPPPPPLGPPLAPNAIVDAFKSGGEGGRGRLQALTVHPLRQRTLRRDLASFLVERQGVLSLPARLDAIDLVDALDAHCQKSEMLVLAREFPGLPVFNIGRSKGLTKQGGARDQGLDGEGVGPFDAKPRERPPPPPPPPAPSVLSSAGSAVVADSGLVAGSAAAGSGMGMGEDGLTAAAAASTVAAGRASKMGGQKAAVEGGLAGVLIPLQPESLGPQPLSPLAVTAVTTVTASPPLVTAAAAATAAAPAATSVTAVAAEKKAAAVGTPAGADAVSSAPATAAVPAAKARLSTVAAVAALAAREQAVVEEWVAAEGVGGREPPLDDVVADPTFAAATDDAAAAEALAATPAKPLAVTGGTTAAAAGAEPVQPLLDWRMSARAHHFNTRRPPAVPPTPLTEHFSLVHVAHGCAPGGDLAGDLAGFL
ncbi:hypothetical protein T492DRAFT_1126685, partial [Pavlovales sp. CCMP2436]